MKADTAQAKQAVRDEMLAIRRALSREARDCMTAALTERIVSLPAFRNAQRIMAYLAMPGEADVDAVIEQALALGKEVYVPCILKGPERLMEAGRLRDMHHFCRGPLGLRALPEGYEAAAPDDLDLVLVPAVACDRQGRRIGMGAGYYDRYLTGVKRERRTAVIWDFQVAGAMPSDRFDQRVSLIVTEKRILSAEEV